MCHGQRKKILNEDILKQVNEKRNIIVELEEKRQSRFIRHILRKEKLENIVDIGSLTKWYGLNNQQHVPKTVNRGETMSVDTALHDDDNFLLRQPNLMFFLYDICSTAPNYINTTRLHQFLCQFMAYYINSAKWYHTAKDNFLLAKDYTVYADSILWSQKYDITYS
jgi:hypothetical protein